MSDVGPPGAGIAQHVIAQRLTSQRLSGPPAASAEEVVTHLLAVQAQDLRGARLSIRSRSTGVTAADVDEALTTRRSLVITWLNRGTLHLVSPDDYWWLHPLTAPQLATGNVRRLRQEGVSATDAEAGVAVIAQAVATDGPQTRSQLRARLHAAGVPTKGQALVHVLVAASLAGHVVRGPIVGAESAYVSVSQWLGEAPAPLARDEALGRLARRYLNGHGPADAGDLAKWAGIPLGDARRGLDAIAGELEVSHGGLVHLHRRAGAAPLPPPRLLGPFEPILLGWVSRQEFVGAHRQVVTNNGLFRPVALADGRVVATWGLAGGALDIAPLQALPPTVRRELRADAARVLRFLALPPHPATLRPLGP